MELILVRISFFSGFHGYHFTPSDRGCRGAKCVKEGIMLICFMRILASTFLFMFVLFIRFLFFVEIERKERQCYSHPLNALYVSEVDIFL